MNQLHVKLRDIKKLLAQAIEDNMSNDVIYTLTQLFETQYNSNKSRCLGDVVDDRIIKFIPDLPDYSNSDFKHVNFIDKTFTSKIDAIKELRSVFGLGLKDAKTVTDILDRSI